MALTVSFALFKELPYFPPFKDAFFAFGFLKIIENKPLPQARFMSSPNYVFRHLKDFSNHPSSIAKFALNQRL